MSVYKAEMEIANKTLLYGGLGTGYVHLRVLYDESDRVHDCLILEANDALLNMLQKQKKEVLGARVTKVVFHDHWSSWLNTCQRVIKTGKNLNIEAYSNSLKEWVNISIFSHEPDYVTCLVHTIDKTKEKEYIEKRQGKFTLLAENTRDFVACLNPIFQFEYVNGAAETFFKLNKQDVIGKRISELKVTTKFKDAFLQALKRAVEKGEHQFFEIHRESSQFVFDIYPEIGENNELRSVLVMGRNLSGLNREMEIKLLQSEALYQRLMEALPNGAIVLHGEKIIYANYAAIKLVGANGPQDLIGRSFLDFIFPEDQKPISKLLKKQGRSERVLFETRLRTIFDGMLNVEILALGIPYCENCGIICTLHDITERKKNEELKRHIEEKERFLAETLEYDRLRTELLSNIAHEFKTPLNVILGTLQLIGLYLKDDSLSPLELKINKKINMMQQNCYRLLRLVNNLIDINKIDSGYFEINLENNDIVKVAEVISVSVKEYIENKGITFEFLTDQEELYTACDPDKIERIILNLLSNAIKFTKPEGKITVSLQRQENMAILSVKDTGIGIPPDKVDIIFDRFSQLDGSLVRKNEGSGIGLSLVKSLVELHGGTVKANSQYGKGTEFIVKLPIKLLAEHQVRVDEFTDLYEKRIEKINIEFSDIYFHR